MKTILIVEDEDTLRQSLVSKVQSSGYVALQAEDGEMGYRILQNNPNVDMILLDLIMPNMDGQTFVYQVNTMLKRDIPIIILTNKEQAAYQSSVVKYLVKANTSLDMIINEIKTVIGEAK